ncbi:MAG: hypothetical protein H0T45_00510 [Pyrinomonadaceae bacterium]|nr:hypothetical protein [Pyrinomonadaceae bacterium]
MTQHWLRVPEESNSSNGHGSYIPLAHSEQHIPESVGEKLGGQLPSEYGVVQLSAS